MAFHPARSRRSDRRLCFSRLDLNVFRRLRKSPFTTYAVLAIAFAVALLLLSAPSPRALAQGAQSAPHITSITPKTGKANDSITINGQNLGKDKVAAVFLSDAKLDHKVTVVDQEPTKIVIKVPSLKPGDYNISVEEGGAIYIQPVIFKVTA